MPNRYSTKGKKVTTGHYFKGKRYNSAAEVKAAANAERNKFSEGTARAASKRKDVSREIKAMEASGEYFSPKRKSKTAAYLKKKRGL